MSSILRIQAITVFVMLATRLSFADTAGSSADSVLSNLLQTIEQRESVVHSLKYEMTQEKRRSIEGSRVLESQLPGTVTMINAGSEVVERKDFLRIREGEKSFLQCTTFNLDLRTISGHIIETWEGETGKLFVEREHSARIERNRVPDQELLADSVAFEFDGKPLFRWLNDERIKLQTQRLSDGISVDCDLNQSSHVKYIFAPEWGYLPKRFVLTMAGQPFITTVIDSIDVQVIDGVKVFFPKTISSTLYIPRSNKRRPGQAPSMVPLVYTNVTVKSVEYNLPTSPVQFDLAFPKGTSVYDEFSGRTIVAPGLTSGQTDSGGHTAQMDIDQQAEQLRSQFALTDSTSPADSGHKPASATFWIPLVGETSLGGAATATGSVLLLLIVIASAIHLSIRLRRKQ